MGKSIVFIFSLHVWSLLIWAVPAEAHWSYCGELKRLELGAPDSSYSEAQLFNETEEPSFVLLSDTSANRLLWSYLRPEHSGVGPDVWVGSIRNSDIYHICLLAFPSETQQWNGREVEVFKKIFRLKILKNGVLLFENFI